MEKVDPMTPVLTVSGVSKIYQTATGQRIEAVRGDIDLSISANSFVCLAGPSGCGK